ncbi:cinnamoyl-CoA reductase 1-like [Punica granatum]|uniref:Cinnamoyl-CoA reductase 1-like n=1 Tax=Punica granatum TaxID=22663 RepID=A0A218WCG6_PUNGR|nr:cinnamoyl-CoA reductase 1-like [Punica granatum]OWM70544.1 hypothetical protein CDL15_Pgr014217 [Punica granatum]
MEMELENKRVCVTGAGGFVAPWWIVKLLLSKGYIVRGTMRDPKDEKYAALNKLERASDNLKHFQADLRDYDSLVAIMGCAGVFHAACPVPTSTLANPEARAGSEAKVRRVVYISFVAAVGMNPNWPKDRAKDETCWSDKEYCNATQTEAESVAFEYGKQSEPDVVAVNPGYVFGAVMQPVLNFSTMLLLKFLKGIYIQIEQGAEDSVPNKFWNIVDVQDVAAGVC